MRLRMAERSTADEEVGRGEGEEEEWEEERTEVPAFCPLNSLEEPGAGAYVFVTE